MNRGDDWRQQAACTDVDTSVFFPEVEAEWAYREAKRVCGLCPVRKECLEFALETTTQEGCYGGKTPAERLSLRAQVA